MLSTARRLRLQEMSVEFRGPLLRFFQRRTGWGEDAEDLVQEVFTRMAGQDLAAIENVQGYIFRIATNVLRDRARRASVRSIVVAPPKDFDMEDESGFSPERILQGKEALQIMVAAMYELPEMVRVVFSQYHFDGVAQVEISRRLGLSLSTIEKHMAKANQHLLYRLRDIT